MRRGTKKKNKTKKKKSHWLFFLFESHYRLFSLNISKLKAKKLNSTATPNSSLKAKNTDTLESHGLSGNPQCYSRVEKAHWFRNTQHGDVMQDLSKLGRGKRLGGGRKDNTASGHYKNTPTQWVLNPRERQHPPLVHRSWSFLNQLLFYFSPNFCRKQTFIKSFFSSFNTCHNNNEYDRQWKGKK